MADQDIPNLAGSDDDIARWIWRNLVPAAGPAATLQGELLRAVEKLRSEAQGNGNINWDDGFELFVDFLEQHLQREPQFSVQARASIATDLERLRSFLPVLQLTDDRDAALLPYVADDLYDRLASHTVNFCRLKPQLIPHQPNPSQQR